MCEVKAAAIVAAAGQGKRMGAGFNKQYLLLRNKPIVVHSLMLLQQLSIINQIILVVPNDEIQFCQEEVVLKYGISKAIVTAGGQERQDSVFNGLQQIKDAQVVVVHDGARPLLTKGKMEEVVREAIDCGAAILAVPVKDTVKIVSETGVVVDTPRRSSLWAAQTPQVFKKVLLDEAYEAARKKKIAGTDDASLVERLGHPVKVVPGSYENIKVTTPEDLLLAEAILKRREEK